MINSLSLFPQSHELDEDEELAAYGIRKTYYKNYKIYFLIDEEEQAVYILRVFICWLTAGKRYCVFSECNESKAFEQNSLKA